MERGSRVSQMLLNPCCFRMRATKHAPRDPFSVLERRHGLAQIVEGGGRVHAERMRVIPPHRVERKTFWGVFGKCFGPNLSV